MGGRPTAFESGGLVLREGNLSHILAGKKTKPSKYQVWSYLHSTFGGSPAVTKLQACQYCLAAAHAEQVIVEKCSF